MFKITKKVKDYKPGDRIVLVKSGKTVTIVAKGNGANAGVTNGTDSWVISGEVEARKA